MNNRIVNPEEQWKQHLVEQINKIADTAPKMIWVTFQKEGIHQFPAALERPDLEDVRFLGYPHRHIFKFKIWIEVKHDDRDIEFIQFKRWVEALYTEQTLGLNNKSCEMISDELYKIIAYKHPGRAVWIEISEDGENGSFTKYKAF